MIKVEHTKTHNIVVFETSAGERTKQVLVAPAKLVLVPIGYTYIDQGEDILDNMVRIRGVIYKSIFISETEKIEVGDLSACYDCTTNEFVGIGTVEEIYENNIAWCSDHKERLNYQFICRKILSLPEHFSPQQLQMIVDGKLKDGDKVLVECENIDTKLNWENEKMFKDRHINSPLVVIKLNPHITIYPVKGQ